MILTLSCIGKNPTVPMPRSVKESCHEKVKTEETSQTVEKSCRVPYPFCSVSTFTN